MRLLAFDATERFVRAVLEEDDPNLRETSCSVSEGLLATSLPAP